MHITRKAWAVALALALVATAGEAWAADEPQAAGKTVRSNGDMDGLTSKFIDVNGVRTRYYDYGQGDPLVLLHGGSIGTFTRPRNSANVWTANIPGLAKTFRVLAPDRIGAGLTDIPGDDTQLSREGDAEHVYQFIKALGLPPVHIAGHSAGGGIAITLALRHPEVVKTLIIVSVGGGADTPLPLVGIQSISYIREWACTSLAKVDEMLAFRCWCNVMSQDPTVWTDEYFDTSWSMYNQPRQRTIQSHLASGAGAAQRQTERGMTWRILKEKAGPSAWQMPILYVAAANDTHDHMPVDQISGMQRVLGLYSFFGSFNDRTLLVVYDEGGHFPYKKYPDRFNYDITRFIEYWKDKPVVK
ncbi:MAG: alpha/beta hydrolase [Acidobacteriota bacterium]